MAGENYTFVRLAMVSPEGILLEAWKKPGTVDPYPEDIYDILDGGTPSDEPPEEEVATPFDGPAGYEVYIDESPLLPDAVWVPIGHPPPPGYEAVVVTLSHRGTKSAAGKGRWGICQTCLEEYPLSEMAKIGGKWYCHRNKCAEEMQS